VVVPRIPGVLAAAGLLAAPVEHEVSAAFSTPLADFDRAALALALDEIDGRAAELMCAEQIPADEVIISYYADVCYIGQSYNLEIPIRLEDEDPGARLYRDFLAAHDRVYGHSVDTPAKIVNIRTVHQARGSEMLPEMRFALSDKSAVLERRDILVSGEPSAVAATVYNRDALPESFRLSGPAIVQQLDTTTLVEPGWDGVVDQVGNLLLTRD